MSSICAKRPCPAPMSATIPASVFKALISHPLTDKGLAAFDADAKKAGVVIKPLKK